MPQCQRAGGAAPPGNRQLVNNEVDYTGILKVVKGLVIVVTFGPDSSIVKLPNPRLVQPLNH